MIADQADPAQPPARTSRVIHARVPDDLATEFAELAQRRNLTTSMLLRELMTQAVQGPPPALPSVAENLEPPIRPRSREDVQRQRFTLRLPAYVVRQAEQRARERRRPLATWLAELVQSNITGSPVLDQSALRALGDAHRELGYLGRNISQIARALNVAHFEVERVKLERLTELKGSIASLKKAVRDVLDVSHNFWRSDN